MRKASKKPAAKKPVPKKSSTEPKRKAQGHSELLDIVARLALITERLAETTERLAQLANQPQPAEYQAQQDSTTGAPPDLTASPIEREDNDEPENGSVEQ